MENDRDDCNDKLIIFNHQRRRKARAPAMGLHRLDHAEILSDPLFKSHLSLRQRFSVPSLPNFEFWQSVWPRKTCLAYSAAVRGVEFLNFNVGGHYTHVTGLGGGVLQPAAWNATPLDLLDYWLSNS
jgi:hypothetical protein